MNPFALGGRMTGALVGEGTPEEARLEGKGPAVLALHGFAGTPRAVRLVVEAAREVGLAAHAPLLPGHGTSSRDLDRATFTTWARAAEEAFDALAAAHGGVIVAGLSLGAVLAAHLAGARPEATRGLVALANALWLPRLFPSAPLVLLETLGLEGRELYFPKLGADITDREAAARHLTYDAYPIRAVFEVREAGRVVRARLGRIHCPTLIVHGARDHVVSPANARRLAAGLGSKDIAVVRLPRSAHVVTEDVDRESLRAELVSFLARVAG